MESYLKFLSRNKLYASIQALGLILSLAFVIILGSYAWQQYSAAHSTPDGDRVYALGMPDYLGLTYGMPALIEERIPEVEAVGVYCPGLVMQLKGQEEVEEVSLSAVNQDFFGIFSNIHFEEGSPAVLESTDNAIVSHSFALRHELKVGSVVELGGNIVVGAIISDIEGSILPNVDMYISDHHKWNHFATETPFDHYGSTIPFLKVMSGTDTKALYAKLESLCKEAYPDFYGQYFFEKLNMPCSNELFFYEGNTNLNHGDAKSIRTLLLVGLLLLLSAVFNYLNLNFALSGKRTKEMAVRRLVGATRNNIRLKYWAESLLFTATCFAMALVVAYALTPEINALLNDPNVPIRISLTPKYVVTYLMFVVILATLAGLLPSRMAASFQPVDVIKGSFRQASKLRFNKVFIILQNTLAVFLIAMAIVMECQYRQSLHRPQHARTADLYYLHAPAGEAVRQTLYDALDELPCVKRIGFCYGAPGVSVGGQWGATAGGDEILYRLYRADSAAFSMLEPEVVENFHAPLYNSVWFGQKAFDATGFTTAVHDISQTLSQRTKGCEQVAGIIEDWVTNGENRGEEDLMILAVQRTEDIGWGGWLIETIGDHSEATNSIAEVLKKEANNKQIVLNYSGYLDDLIAENLRPQHNAMRLMEIFMLLAILISILGLVAMSTYYSGQQSKSIAIRKVFGGTVTGETRRNIGQYMMMSLVACAIGIPIAVVAARDYLQDYICRIHDYGWIFVLAVVINLVTAFLSVLWQTLRSACTNPATELKKE